MANTGFDWTDYQGLGSEDDPSGAIVDYKLNLNGTVTSEEISLDILAGCEIGIECTYDAAVQAAGTGTSIYVLKRVKPGGEGSGNFETIGDGAWGVMLAFTASSTHRKVFSVSPATTGSFKIIVINTNSTPGISYVSLYYRTADVPAAS